MKSITAKLAQFLALYGGWGLLAISFLDSSILSLPLVNDLLLIHLAARQPERVVLYALQSTAGSILGAYLTYAIARGGGKYLLRKISAKKLARAQHWLDRNDFVSVLVASLLPPPAPFKVFLIAAGILRVNPVRFGAALLVGRGARFLAEGYLGARYGLQAEQYLKENLAWVSLVAVVVVVAGTVIYRRLTEHWRQKHSQSAPRASSSDQG
jgi:membrane protein YqaA with SNARE-associated domain